MIDCPFVIVKKYFKIKVFKIVFLDISIIIFYKNRNVLREMAQSVKTDFSLWSQFDHHAYEIMTEGFVHDNLLKINTNIMSAKGRVRLQETLMQRVNSLRTTG